MNKKRVLISAVLLLLSLIIVYVFFLSGKHRVIANEDATIVLKSDKLYAPFKNNQSAITAKYIDQVAQVQGLITSISKNTIELDNIIQVDLNNDLKTNLEKGNIITIKGRCVGYDDLFDVVKIDQAIVLPKE